MDLVYSDINGVDAGVMQRYFLDLEESTKVGSNTFQIANAIKNNVLAIGCFLHMEGTEYGGRIDSVKVDTKKKVIYHSGKTWRGILEDKIIEPGNGEDYYSVSGDANTILGQIIEKIGVSSLFVANAAMSNIDITNYQFERYIDAYSGILKMLSKNDAKLRLEWIDGHIMASAIPIVDYSNEAEISSDLFDFVIEQGIRPVNHMIGLGKGELANRQVVHKYIDANGNVSNEQYYFGADEMTKVYDYPNCESLEELEAKTEDELSKVSVASKVKITANNLSADIGDKFTARDEYSGISATQYVINKIVTIENDKIEINYKVGDIL